MLFRVLSSSFFGDVGDEEEDGEEDNSVAVGGIHGMCQIFRSLKFCNSLKNLVWSGIRGMLSCRIRRALIKHPSTPFPGLYPSWLPAHSWCTALKKPPNALLQIHHPGYKAPDGC